MKSHHKTVAIIAAAGSGKRMGSGISKQYIEIEGGMVLERSLKAFCSHPFVDEVWLAVKKEDLEFCKARWLFAPGFEKLRGIMEGGAERQDTVALALKHLSEAASPDVVLIHDGARPFVTSEEIRRLTEAAIDSGAAVLAVPVKDTIKRAEGDFFVETPDRKNLYAVQTPQGFAFDLLCRAYKKAEADGFYGTDDAQLVERLGEKVRCVMGEYSNKKITTPEDLEKHREWRTGTGFDVHAFTEGRKLILGGVEIPNERGLLGHSDADVLTHALMDALLGACGLEDIGFHFSDRDPQYLGIDSLVLLRRVAEMVKEKGFQISNVDMTLIGEKPKIAPYKKEMGANFARCLGLSEDRINIKGTTTEKLGFCGRGEGLSAMACATVFRG